MTQQTTQLPVSDILFGGAPELPPVYLDRTTLERYARCPWQGWTVEVGHVEDVSFPADSGSEAHRVIGEAVAQYAREGIPPREYMEEELPKARPDVQPDVLAGVRPSLWAIGQFLTSRHPNDLIAYQGGEGDHSGQFAREFSAGTPEKPATIITSEVDMLLAGTTTSELLEIDFKTGHTSWSSVDVRDSWQFRLHAWLLFEAFPGLEYLHVDIWMTRLHSHAPTYTFVRKRMSDFDALLASAVQIRERMHLIEDAAQAKLKERKKKPTFKNLVLAMLDALVEGRGPSDTFEMTIQEFDKCGACPAKLRCPHVLMPVKEIAEDPERYANDTNTMEAAVAFRKDLLRKHHEAHGEIEGKTICFGLNAPKRVSKPRANEFKFYAPEPEPQPKDKDDEKSTDAS